MQRMLDHVGLDVALRQCGLPLPGSNRGYSPIQLVTQFLLNIWCGGNRFEHAEVVRHDTVLQRLFGFARMANFKALIRFFNKFNQATNAQVFGRLYRWLFDQIQVDRLTLDLDSTVMTRYGTQAGAAKGYNPRRRGRLSHHPLMAFVADLRLIANCWLRPGNTASSSAPRRPAPRRRWCCRSRPAAAWPATSAPRPCCGRGSRPGASTGPASLPRSNAPTRSPAGPGSSG